MITTHVTINLTSQVSPQLIQAVQGDTGRSICFKLADFTIPAGAAATYYVQKPSGEAIYNSATISGNEITCELTAQSLAEIGENPMQVRISADGEIVTSFDAILLVRPFRGIDAIESSTEINIFDQAVEQAAEDFQEQAEQIVEEVIESIPADYTALTEEVDELNERLGEAPKISTPEETEADLYICDAQGNVIGKFVGGYLVTKNFDGEQVVQDISELQSDVGDLSELETTAKDNLVEAINEAAQSGATDIIMDTDEDTADLYICDNAGNVIAEFPNGYIKTKNFDSYALSGAVSENTAKINDMKRVRTRMEFGAHNGAEYYAPECTIPAYRIAGQQGWEWAWIAGIAFSSEGSMYVIHDDTVDRTTDGTGYISQMTDAQIDALNIDQTGPGYDLADFDPAELKVPTLEQVIQQCVRYGMKMVLRLSLFPNDDSTVDGKAKWDALVDLINGYNIKPQDISCYVDSGTKAATCRRLFGDDVEVSTFLGSSATAQTYVTWFSDRSLTGTLAAIINVSQLDLSAVKLLHANGIRVYAYNSASVDVASNCATMGVDVFQNGKVYKLTE